MGAFLSNLLPHSITVPCSIIVNTDKHTQAGTHLQAICLEHRSSTVFYFKSYGLSPDIIDMQSFLRRNCTVLYSLWKLLLSVRPLHGLVLHD
jgi:hypothetical protein